MTGKPTPSTDFATLTSPGQGPKITTIFDFSAEALGELRLWLEQNPPSISIKNVLGYSIFQQQCFLTRSAGQTVATGAYALITWDTETVDTANFHSVSANTNRITIPTGQDGNYLVGANVVFGVGAGTAVAVITKNAELTGAFVSTGVQASEAKVLSGSASNSTNLTVPLKLVAGDYVSLSFFQNTGGNMTVPDVTNFPASGFWCARLS